MKIIQNEKIFGLNLREQYIVTLSFLILIAAFSTILFILARKDYDTFTGIISFGFMILSSIGAIGVILKNYEIPLGLSLLGIMPCLLITLFFISDLFFDPQMSPGSMDPFFISFLIPLILLLPSCLFSWNLARQKRFVDFPQLRHVRKSNNKFAAASILVGGIGLFIVMEVVPIGLALGIIAIFLGMRALRKKDKAGQIGIVLGSLSIVYSIIFWIAFFAGYV